MMNGYPPGWDAERVQKVLDHHNGLLDDEDALAADIEAVDSDPNMTWVAVPRELVPAVLDLIEERAEKQASQNS